MSGKSRMKDGRSVQTVSTRLNFFENKGKVVWSSGKNLIQFKPDSTSIWQAFDFFQGFRPVQTDPIFVRQIGRAEVETA